VWRAVIVRVLGPVPVTGPMTVTRFARGGCIAAKDGTGAGALHAAAAGAVNSAAATSLGTAGVGAAGLIACSPILVMVGQFDDACHTGVLWLAGYGTSGRSGQSAKIVQIPEVSMSVQSATVTITRAVTVAAGEGAAGPAPPPGPAPLAEEITRGCRG
jgi:hypothetical protein